MTEIRLRPRQVLIIIAVFALILWYVNIRSKCVPSYFQELYHTGDLPKVYAVTPTYARPVQIAELTRLSHVIKLVPNVHWVVVEDATETSNLVNNLVRRAGLSDRCTLLFAKTPDKFKLKSKDPNWVKPRGVEQRNTALKWVRENAKENHSVLYFMDDDNTYSVEVFREMSLLKPGEVGVWPVGLVGGLKVEKPILDKENKVKGFNSVWRPERPFALDMAGFAISTDLLLLRPEAVFNYEIERGFQESEILRHLVTIENLRPLANLCKKVLVWHTRTEKPKLTEEEKLNKKGERSDDGIEV